jgi:hypothetical protein
MASSEGTRSPFSTQPSSRSPKLRLYENLFLWNQGIDQLVAILRRMEKFSFEHKSVLQHAQNEIEEVRAEVNADLLEEQAEFELKDAGRFFKRRRAYEKQREDPDDVYIEVERREAERKKQGLPTRIGIIPDRTLTDEDHTDRGKTDEARGSARSPQLTV